MNSPRPTERCTSLADRCSACVLFVLTFIVLAIARLMLLRLKRQAGQIRPCQNVDSSHTPVPIPDYARRRLSEHADSRLSLCIATPPYSGDHLAGLILWSRLF